MKKIIIISAIVLSLPVFLFAQATPQVVTQDVSDRGVDEATLHMTFSLSQDVPFGQVYFEYGRNDLYGSITSPTSVTESGTHHEKVTGLNEHTGYHFRAALLAADGTTYYGNDKSFITKLQSDISDPDSDISITSPVTPTIPTETPTTPARPTECLDTDGDGACDWEECGLEDSTEELNQAQCDAVDLNNNGEPDYQDPDIQSTSPQAIDDSIASPTLVSPNVPASPITLPSTVPASGGGTIGTGSLPGTTANGLVPDCSKNTDRTGKIVGCQYNDVITLIQNILNWFIGISVLVGTALFVWGGFLYMADGGNSKKTAEAKKIFKSVFIGLFFVLTAWLIVDFILDKLVVDEIRNDASVDVLERN